jgi:anti-sigma-K factor RskA
MNWYLHPELINQLAAEYTLGTLKGRARLRFEAVMRSQPEVMQAAVDWQNRLSPLLESLPEESPQPQTWLKISSRLWPDAAAKQGAWWQRLFASVFAPLPVSALALGVMLGTVLPSLWQTVNTPEQLTQLPESYVGVLATQNGKPGLIVSSLRHGLTVDIKQIAAVPVPAGHTLYLWTVDKAGIASPIGPIANEKFTRVQLLTPSEKAFFPAMELAVSTEPVGLKPASPSQPFVYRGLCGKLWQVPASK